MLHTLFLVGGRGMRDPHANARDGEFEDLRSELEVPPELTGFGNYLVWLVATRAADLVDAVYDSGVGRPSPKYRMPDGHNLPTQAMFARFIVANERGLHPAQLPRNDENLTKAVGSLRATMTPAMGEEPQRFKAPWLHGVAVRCALTEAELRFLERARSKFGVELNPVALRKAVAVTRASGLPAHRHESPAVTAPADTAGNEDDDIQVVVGEVPGTPLGFVARDLVDTLAVAAAAGRVAVICAVTGLRGVGKTQLAAAYARQRITDGWRLIGWIDAESRQSLVLGLAAVAGALGVADPGGDSEKSANRLRDHLQARAEAGLLVFDNALSPAAVAPFLLANGGTQVIITSTNQAFAQFGVTVDVSVFTREESVGYLGERTGLSDVAGAAAVAVELGDLPLALAQAAAVLSGQRLSYPDYLERLRAIPAGRVLRGISGIYPKGVAAALLDSVRAAEGGAPDGLAGRLLRVMALLSPAGVRRDLLAGLAARPYAVDEAAEGCVAWSLLTWSVSGEELIMHRMLARALRERDQEEDRWQQTVADTLGLLEPNLFEETEAWPRRAEGSQLAAHVDAAWAATTSAPVSRDLTRRLLRARVWAVRQLAGSADLGTAVEAGTGVLADCTSTLGAEDRVTLAAREALAIAYKVSGQLSTARGLYEQNLADRRRLLGAADLDTLETLNNYGELHISLKQPAAAAELFEQALLGRERALPSDDYLVFESRVNLAAALSLAGRLPEAMDLDEQTLAERLASVGSDHGTTDFVRGNLAFKYRLAGRLAEATTLNEQLYESRRRVYGDAQPTFIAATNLGDCYAAARELDKAVALHERTLDARLRVLGRAHPDTMRSRHALAVTYADLGRYDEAITLHELNLTERLRYLSPDNPQTMETIEALESARSATPSAHESA
jgi:tetratricopeptide (TPR) repeat protein